MEYHRHCHHQGAQICWPQRRLPSSRRRPVTHLGTPTLQSVPTIEKQFSVVWTYIFEFAVQYFSLLTANLRCVWNIFCYFCTFKHNTGLTSRVADRNSHDSVDSLWWESSRRGRGGRCKLPPTLSPPPPPKDSSDNWNKKDIASLFGKYLLIPHFFHIYMCTACCYKKAGNTVTWRRHWRGEKAK